MNSCLLGYFAITKDEKLAISNDSSVPTTFVCFPDLLFLRVLDAVLRVKLVDFFGYLMALLPPKVPFDAKESQK